MPASYLSRARGQLRDTTPAGPSRLPCGQPERGCGALDPLTVFGHRYYLGPTVIYTPVHLPALHERGYVCLASQLWGEDSAVRIRRFRLSCTDRGDLHYGTIKGGKLYHQTLHQTLTDKRYEGWCKKGDARIQQHASVLVFSARGQEG